MNLEPIRALVRILQQPIERGEFYVQAIKQRFGEVNTAADAALPALSQLLEAVTNLEKLEVEWRERAAKSTAKGKATKPATYLRCADDLKRLLHPEDTK